MSTTSRTAAEPAQGRELTGQLVRMARESAGMTREELAFRMQQAVPGEKWGYWRVTNLETGRTVLEAHQLSWLAHVLDVPAAFFIYGPGPFRGDARFATRMADVPPCGIEVGGPAGSTVTAR